MSELALIQGLLADRQSDATADVLSSQVFGVRPANAGHLFGGVQVAPVQGDRLADILKLTEWMDLSGGCRVLPRRIGIKLSADTGVVAERTKIRLLLRHDDLWSDNDAARTGEAFVLYPIGKPQPSGGGIPYYVRSVLQEVHAFEFNGKRCVGIDLPTGSYGAYVDLGDGAVVGLYPSLGFVVLRD